MTLPLLMHAADNNGLFPASIDLAASHFQNAFQADPFLRDELEFVEATQQFEIVYQGSRDDLTNAGSTILVREKQARQRPDGKWEKAYGFADGHGEVRVETENNFDAWERRRVFQRLQSRNQGLEAAEST